MSMTRFALFALLVSGVAFGFLSLSFSPCAAADTQIKRAVVKIYTVQNRYNYHEPWQALGQTQTHGSGCVIDGRRILTNAHVVSDQTFVQVRRSGEAKKYTAKVQSVSHQCDLAILTVEDPGFFQGIEPLEIGELPNIRDRVAVYGYPEGGDTLGITEGVVSRVEHREYSHGQSNLLAAQIDAPINNGSSGGPVIVDGRLVGIAFQGLNGSTFENIGYMVPTPVIQQFLKDIGDGRHDGVPELGLSMQKLENIDLQTYFGLGEKQSGALVNKVYPDSPAEGILFADDVILTIDGHRVENDGTIEFRPGERTYLGYIWQGKQRGDTIALQVARNGEVRDAIVPLTASLGFDRLVPGMQYDRPASYFIAGGLVFAPLTLNYLKEYGSDSDWLFHAPKDLLYQYLYGEPGKDRRQVVMLIKVLADDLNVGYHSFVNGMIATVNNHTVSTIEDVVRAFEGNTGPYHIVEDVRGYRLVLNRANAVKQNSEILKRYRIGSDRSDDLKVLMQ